MCLTDQAVYKWDFLNAVCQRGDLAFGSWTESCRKVRRPDDRGD